MNPSISNDRVRDVVKTINGNTPDINWDVIVLAGVTSVNNISPDVFGNVNLTVLDIWAIASVSSNTTLQVLTDWNNDVSLTVNVDNTTGGNALQAWTLWMYVASSASAYSVVPYGAFISASNVQTALEALSNNSITTANDTDTINFSTGGWAITGDVRIDPSLTNAITSSSNGLYVSKQTAIDVPTGSLSWYGFPWTTSDVRDALIYLGANRVISQPIDWSGIPTNHFLADTSINWRTGAMVNEYMQKYTNPYGVPGYDAEFGVVANPNLGSGVAFTLSAFWDDSQRFTLWIDASGKVRVKSGTLPTADSDWVVVGTQS